jgi:hypothetical protein
MNTYLARIVFQGELDFSLVKASNRQEAKAKVESYYYGYVKVEIKETITEICPE